MTRTTYLVVVYPAPPETRQPNTFSSNTPSSAARVKKVTASSAQEAASTVGVQAGEHALVAAERDLQRFDRARQAPLEETDPRTGSYLPTVGEAA